MSGIPDGVRDLIAAVALGAATRDEVERIARQDARVARELQETRVAADGLALAVTAPAERTSPLRRLFPRFALPALAAGMVVLALALLAGPAIIGDDSSPVRFVAVGGSASAPGVDGRLILIPDEDTAVLRLSGLRSLPPGRGYELWVFRGDVPESAGLLAVAGPGEGRIVATGGRGARRFAVTVGDRTPHSLPTTTPILDVELDPSA